MKVVVAIDSLKGSLSSIEAGNAIKEGIQRVDRNVEVVVRPLADGGEGSVEALVEGCQGKLETITVSGPLGKSVKASYGILPKSHTAIIEVACAAGITLIDEKEKNPMLTTSYGVGEVIKDAIDKGNRRFIIGLGGSVTNDGGVGMLQALGFDFLDENNQPIPLGAQGLKKLKRIDQQHALDVLKECEFMIACDVNNPLCGKQGASAVYGPQKGATQEMVEELDRLLDHLSIITKQYYPSSDATLPGSGAAGGLGFAFSTFLSGKLQSGIELILQETALESYLQNTDIVITGEGCLDFQTSMGKAPIGVAKLAKKYHIPVIAFAGCVTEDAHECNRHGIDAFFPILRNIMTLEEALDKEQAKINMINTVEQVFRLWQMKK
ncbi:glycerate kinase family protein [Candidatus Stoquefichus sp. SB1]|uniref:glycerate kinase family protein n=1 Tax=Candidatus Stoquefichus sp. SB1 TaxID=1658109 RepID=UPI00067EA1B8|nr:glycerate kinase [Candidatus Stoquefichus sp. SB1]